MRGQHTRRHLCEWADLVDATVPETVLEDDENGDCDPKTSGR
jgi:hypothetical protein